MHNFFALKEEKVTEKAFSRGLLISVLGILICIVALCSATFAWFVGEAKSDSNVLMAGSFDLTVTVAKDGGDVPVTPDPVKRGIWNCNLETAGTYQVTLKLKEGSTVKGHCVVKAGNGDWKHTDALFKADPAESGTAPSVETFTFTITVTEPTVASFEPRWGVVVTPDIPMGGAYPMPAASGDDPNA